MRFVCAVLLGLLAVVMPVSAAWAGEQVPQSTRDLQMTFSPLVKKTAPAVVNIYAKRLVRERMAVISPFLNDPFFNQFFGGALGMPGGTRERVENSLGSGVIVDPSGIIATNSHVVGQATEISVVMADGREFTAEKILGDDETDLAVLRIDPKGEVLPALALADSDQLEVGDIVLAIGNPFGLGQTVTSGIVSGLSRTGVGPSEYGFFIQTDAAINPGNSGGALVDVNGGLIGINSMIFSRTGASHGIGFAIPANMVKTVIDTAKAGGTTVVRPWTGFTGQSVTSDMIESLGLSRAQGVLVNQVRADSPADKAGLEVGDVITAINGVAVRDPQSLHFRLAVAGIGAEVELAILRRTKAQTLSLKTMRAPETPPRETTDITGANPLQGATVANLSPAVAQEIDVDDSLSGVVVLKAETGIARRMGLRRGDIIAALNGTRVQSVKELLAVIKQQGKPPRWTVGILRNGQILNVVVAG